jgi:arsenate reductase
MATVIYHNPRCSKSRATLALLESKGIKPEIVKYLESLPSKAELKEILQRLGKSPQEIIRFSESAAKEAGIGPDDVRDLDEWLDILTQHPVLMQRPIVVKDGKARIGRPPEDVLEII